MTQLTKSSLKFTLISECNVSNARTGVMNLTHYNVETPVFMPVGTQVILRLYLFYFNVMIVQI